MPAELCADAGAEGFADRFLAGKSRGDALGGVVLREAVFNFRLAQHAIQKPLAPALANLTDALHFHNVDAGTKNHLR